MRFARLALAVLALGAMTDLKAAYVDPAGTSLFLQILAPVFLVLSLFGKSILRMFQKGLSRFKRDRNS